MARNAKTRHLSAAAGVALLLWFGLMPQLGHAEDPATEAPQAETPTAEAADASAVEEETQTRTVAATLETLDSFVDLRNEMLNEIKETNKQLAAAKTDTEKANLKAQLDQLESDLRAITRNFENIAAGVDITSLRSQAVEEFSFQRELMALLKPAIDEMKEMTAHVRQKSDLREQIVYFEERLPVMEQALANVQRLAEESSDGAITQALKLTAENWQRQQSVMKSELQAAQLQLEKLEAAEVSLSQASQSYLKAFFQERPKSIFREVLTQPLMFVDQRFILPPVYNEGQR